MRTHLMEYDRRRRTERRAKLTRAEEVQIGLALTVERRRRDDRRGTEGTGWAQDGSTLQAAA